MPMKKFIFLTALVVMGFACIGCSTNDTTNNGSAVETPATDNGTGTGTGTSTDNALGTDAGNTTGVMGTDNATTNGAVDNNSNVDDAANGVVTDQNGIINDGDNK